MRRKEWTLSAHELRPTGPKNVSIFRNCSLSINRLRPKEMGQGGGFFDGKENGSFGSRF